MQILRTTYDGFVIYKNKGRKVFLATVRLQNRKIVQDSIFILAYDILKTILACRKSTL